jgi:hypothetical protein
MGLTCLQQCRYLNSPSIIDLAPCHHVNYTVKPKKKEVRNVQHSRTRPGGPLPHKDIMFILYATAQTAASWQEVPAGWSAQNQADSDSN